MTTHFDRWEKDPFFSAAEEVQESADRMESTYRTWLHAKKDTSGPWNIDELRRDLQTTLGTTKWQLEEFEKAVNSSYKNGLVDDSKDRHHDFIVAMDSQVKKVEKSLNEAAASHGKPPNPWTRLDEGEYDELALFLSGPAAADVSEHQNFGRVLKRDLKSVSLQEVDKQMTAENSKESSYPLECNRPEAMEYSHGHRRAASASADISSWKISVADDSFNPGSSNEQPGPTPRKVPSFSGFLNTLESATTQLKWPRNGYRKLKLLDRGQEADTLPQSKQLTKGLTSCYERSKSCLDGCDDYDKPFQGWYGAVQRQLQRSQYHVQYSRPVQIVFSIVLLLCLIVMLAMHAT
ncbi:hypothetical protein Leryth_005374 [Lithospermum erythrorhizon]|nr:hypothetical protein Leryth_005374 [Lithospermum erythrorhizon]